MLHHKEAEHTSRKMSHSLIRACVAVFDVQHMAERLHHSSHIPYKAQTNLLPWPLATGYCDLRIYTLSIEIVFIWQ